MYAVLGCIRSLEPAQLGNTVSFHNYKTISQALRLPGFACQEIKGGLAAISLAKMPSAVLRCAVLRCAALCCAVLRCAVLRCAVLCRVLPRHAMPCYEPCQSFAFLHHADASFESATITCAQLGVCEVWRCMVQTMPRMP